MRTTIHTNIRTNICTNTQKFKHTYKHAHKHMHQTNRWLTVIQMDDDNLDKFHVPLYFTHADENLTPSSFLFATGLGKRAASSKGTKEYIDFDDVLGAYRATLPLSFACLCTHTYTHICTHKHTCTHTMCTLPPHPPSFYPHPPTLLCLFPSRHFLCVAFTHTCLCYQKSRTSLILLMLICVSLFRANLLSSTLS